MTTTKRSTGWRALVFEVMMLVGGFVGLMMITRTDSRPAAGPEVESCEECEGRGRFTLALACAGALVAFAGILFTLRAWYAVGSPEYEEVARSPEFVVWEALTSFMVVIYVVLCAWSARGLKGQWQKTGRGAGWLLVLYVILAFAVLVFLWFGLPKSSGPPPANITLVTYLAPALGVAAAAPSVLGLWLTSARLHRMSAVPEAPPRAGGVIDDLIGSRKDLGRHLAVLSVIVSIGVVATGGYRSALLANGITEQQFPKEHVLLYGAFFTAVTLLIYSPVFLAWRSRALTFIDVRYPLPADGLPAEDWAAGRTRLAALLGTDATLSTNLTVAFGILAPFVTSALTVLMPK
jgi:hypothetical protein